MAADGISRQRDETLRRLSAYADFWQRLTVDDLERLGDWFTEDARFADPFNDVRGLPHVRAVFAHSLGLVTDVSIELTDRAIGEDACYLRWVYRYRTRQGGKPWRIVGMTELHFAEDGRVSAHVDHWDAAGQVYEKLPVIGAVLRAIRRKLQP